jgi:hypothetical protein
VPISSTVSSAPISSKSVISANGRWTLPYTMLLFCAVMGGLWLGEEIAEILRPNAARRAKAPQGTFQ